MAVEVADGAASPPEHAWQSTDPVERLSAMLVAAGGIAGTDWHEVDGHRLHEALGTMVQLVRVLSGTQAQMLSTIEANGLWALDGQRTFAAWLRTQTDATAQSASRQVRHARALRDLLPLSRAALAQGRISEEHVGVLVRGATATDRLRVQLSDDQAGEAFLVEQAQRMDAGSFAKLVSHWAIAADPEAADRAWREDGAKEQLTLSRTMDGYHLNGWLDELSGQSVDTALRAHMGRKAKGDERTPAQRRAAALTSLARQSLDAGEQGKGARIRPHVSVTADIETLRALAGATGSPRPPVTAGGREHEPGGELGFWEEALFTAPGGPRDPSRSAQDPFTLSPQAQAWMDAWQPGDTHVISTAIDPRAVTGIKPATLEDGTPIPPAMLARLVCESSLSRVVFGPDSTVLDVGREQRIFPAHMVRAIIARDKTCQYPDCDQPPGAGEIHHSLQWYRDGGDTCVEHGILLCWHHHDWVHAYGTTIVRAAGRWHFYTRHGQLITAKHEQT
ncbi:HNH endonuclease [Georgenia satyanarayanai]|uniref:HNH endonuclease signature motif containing protein n=1 Tax=Georgenia satyanarayanai TaxID=860221 RepID=UPI0020414FC4|nr:HNH endonuclease signature motif containing protein [Georgenia satyanarayanai]MCM3661360.1 HNH endonuclease [Georgenia satyanarayanai]